MNLFFLLNLGACVGTEVEYGSGPCEGWSFSDEEPIYTVSREGENLRIEKMGAFQSLDATFMPEVSGQEFSVAIIEDWDSSGSDETTCFTAFVTLLAPTEGDWLIYWFDESSLVNAAFGDVFVF